ncbi:hypothetical protein [Calothrix sp. NIES-2100]
MLNRSRKLTDRINFRVLALIRSGVARRSEKSPDKASLDLNFSRQTSPR